MLWGCQSAAQRLAQLDTVPRVGQPQAISTTLTSQDAAHLVPSVTSQMKSFTPWFLGATVSLPQAPAPPGLLGSVPSSLSPSWALQGEQDPVLWQGLALVSMVRRVPARRAWHRWDPTPGTGQGRGGGRRRRLSPHQLFTSVFIEGNVFNNAWRGAAGPFESLPRCS